MERLREQIKEMRRLRSDWFDSRRAEEMWEKVRAKQETVKVWRQQSKQETAEQGEQRQQLRADLARHRAEKNGQSGLGAVLCLGDREQLVLEELAQQNQDLRNKALVDGGIHYNYKKSWQSEEVWQS